MKNLFRRILFFSLFFLFLISLPILLIYSQGIRIDFENKKLTFTGTIYLKAIPKSAEIYLNGKFIKKTDSLFGTAKIENLIPKKYKIALKKEGYLPWEKELEVKAKMVTQVSQIILIPKKIKFEKANFKIEDFENLKTKKLACKELKISEKCFFEKIEDEIFLIFGEKLYSLKDSFELIFENLRGWEKKGKEILVFLPHEIWILKKSQREFLIREAQEIKDVAFLNEKYFAYLVGNKVKIGEIDDFPNVYEICEIEGQKIAINEKREILILKGNEIFVSNPIY